MNSRLRDILLFTAGLFVLMHQTLISRQGASPTLVGASLAMMLGAPVVYRWLDRSSSPPSQDKEDDK